MRYLLVVSLSALILIPGVIAPVAPIRYVFGFVVEDGTVTSGNIVSLRNADSDTLDIEEGQIGEACAWPWDTADYIFEEAPTGIIRTVGLRGFCGASESLAVVDGIANQTWPYLGQSGFVGFNCDPSLWWQCLDEYPYPWVHDGSSTFLQSVVTTGPFNRYVNVGLVNLSSAFTVDGGPAIPDYDDISEIWVSMDIRAVSPTGSISSWLDSTMTFQFGYDRDDPGGSFFCGGGSGLLMPFPDNTWQTWTIGDRGTCNGASEFRLYGGQFYAYIDWSCTTCVAGPPFGWIDITRVYWGVNLTTSDHYSLEADFDIRTNSGDTGQILELDAGSCDAQYDIGLVNGTTVDWLGNACTGVTTFAGYIPKDGNGVVTVRITDNTTATDGGGISIDYLRIRYAVRSWIGGDSMAWLFLFAFVTGGVLLAAWTVMKWRDSRA
jgi:hypothetical protein